MFGHRNHIWLVIHAILVVFLVVGVAVVPATAGGTDGTDTGRIISIHRTGDAVVTKTNETTYVWQSERYTADVKFRINSNVSKYSVCLLESYNGKDPHSVVCQSATVGNGSTTTVTLNGTNASETGKRTLYFRLRPTFGSDVPIIDSRTINQTVITKGGDYDQDGLTNEFEADKIQKNGWPADALNDSDMDSDGLNDGEEVNKWGTNPVTKDSDNDSILDGKEILSGTNPNKADSDGDGVNDAKDPEPMNPNVARSTTQASKTTTATKHQQSSGLSGIQLLLVGVVGIGIFGAAALLWRVGRDDPDPPTPVPESGTTSIPVTKSEEGDADGDEDILTDEGQVLKLLRNNRDRMKQVDIVEKTGWSKSKVSRLLSRMEERGDINRLRVGRGNIVYLEGAKPNGARSPHEEDSYS